MNGKKAKALRRKVTGDPDMTGKMFSRADALGMPITATQTNHPTSFRAQYQGAKKEEARK
jgi:hypothetical protein